MNSRETIHRSAPLACTIQGSRTCACAEQQTVHCAQLHGVTELWRGGETELEASRPAPASSNFAALQTAMAGYSVDTM